VTATDRMNIDRRSDGLSPVQRRAEAGGFNACASGLSRDQNPYTESSMKPFVDQQTAQIAHLLAEAWWRGCDRGARDNSTDPAT
jgi:hypothetical protein